MRYSEFANKFNNYPYFRSDSLRFFGKQYRTLQNQLKAWEKQGKIIRLRREFYTLNDKDRRVGLSRPFIANSIYPDSYISLEYAMSLAGLIPEMVSTLTCVSLHKRASFENAYGLFTYRQISPSIFFGFRKEKDEFGLSHLIAEPEKALLDFLFFAKVARPSRSFLEDSLRLQNLGTLAISRLREFAKRFAMKKIELFCSIIIDMIREERA